MESSIWHLYLIRCADGSLYAGISTDVARRYETHCAGRGARYTRMKKPVSLVGSKACGTKSDALKAEIAVRKLKASDRLAYIERIM